MQISGHKNVAFINNYSTLSEERHKKISNILSNTESETNRNAFQQTYLVKPPQILQPVALLMFRVEAIPMFLLTVPIQICQVKLVLCFTAWSSITKRVPGRFAPNPFRPPRVVSPSFINIALKKKMKYKKYHCKYSYFGCCKACSWVLYFCLPHN